IFEQPGCDTPSFTAIFKKYKFIAGEQATDAQLLVGELSNLTYFVTHYFPVMEKHYQGFGFTDLHITPKIDYELTDRLVAEYEKKSEAALADILANQPEPSFSNEPAFPTAKEENLSPTHLALGKEIKATDTVFQMQDVVNEEANVVFEGYVFAAEHKVFKNRTTGKESHMLEVKMTDYSSSFIIQKWGRKPEEQAMFDLVKKGMWLKVKGSVQMDQYKHELVMSVRDMVEIKAKNIRKDLMPDDQKRVEFHAHTNMSTMDAITDVSDLVAQAARWGHEAIAITDHAGAQSFPHAHSAGKKNGVKILYGIEANLVEDRVPITYNEDDSELSDATYVVFDVETTGLSAVYNKLIQVAASKMHKGNVIEQFDEFIDPGHPVSEFTTQLTGITDDMVRGSKPLEEVLVAFQAFCQDSILVAHNATFDVGFMNINYQRYDLPIITQPVIDTLEFARNLYPEIKRHGLGPLTKRFQVSLENHHLANFDAEATGRLLFIFLNDAKEKFKITLLSDLNTKVVDENSYKRARVKHATIYAKTQAGLKNLFKLISFSNVNYFAGVPRIPKSVLETYREGLII
ncbi:MAG: PHP domain-containing protein, partial [Lactococcus sp.]|nr:PHP domain-containing protein [Lactococcus sp.]